MARLLETDGSEFKYRFGPRFSSTHLYKQDLVSNQTAAYCVRVLYVQTGGAYRWRFRFL